MTGNEYLQKILNEKTYVYSAEQNARYQAVLSRVFPIINQWSMGYLEEVFQSGSSAKGTAIKGKSDVDIFISIKSSCNTTLENMFNSLGNAMTIAGYNVRRQNVSIGIKVGDIDVDLVPGKKDTGNTNYHKLYVSKKGSWTQTNVKLQIRNIQESRRAKFIQLTKIWRDCHHLEFPSINIELAVIEALKGYPYDTDLNTGFLRVLKYIRDNIMTLRLVDPGNSANILSDDMTENEKRIVQMYAQNSSAQEYWKDIIW